MSLPGQDGMENNLQNLISRLENDEIDVVHVGIFDLDGGFRERRLRRDDLASYGEGGTFVNVLPRWDVADSVFGEGPFVGERIALDPSSLRGYPFEPGAALLVADYAGVSAPLSPRAELSRQITQARQLGFDVHAAFEFEFIVLNETAESLRAKGFSPLALFAPDNRCWGAQTAAAHATLVADLERCLNAADIAPLALGVELGPGCFEATLRSTTGLKAADDASFFRLFTKAFLRERGLTGSFMAQLGAGFPGLSGHIHLSLTRRSDGANAFFDGDASSGPSATCRAFLGGMSAIVPEAFPMVAQSVNAYRRLTPPNWAARNAGWAVQDYAAGVRVVEAPETACRLEFRLPAADTNPYLSLACMIGAGLWGIRNDCAPPPPISGVGTGDGPPPAALPHDLYEAVARMQSSSLVREVFGDEFIDHFSASRRHEELVLRRQVSAAEVERYLEAV